MIIITFKTAIQMILNFNYVSFYFKLPISETGLPLKKGHFGLEIPGIVAFNS
jgi:hypothetical protein